MGSVLNCDCVRPTDEDGFIKLCIEKSDNQNVKKVSLGSYQYAKCDDNTLRYVAIDEKKYILYDPQRFYYEGDAKVIEDGSTKVEQQGKQAIITLQAQGKGTLYWYAPDPAEKSNKNIDLQTIAIKYVGDFKNNLRQGKGVYTSQNFKFNGDWERNIPKSGYITMGNVNGYIPSLNFENENKGMMGSINKKYNFDRGNIVIEFLDNKNKYSGQFKYNPEQKVYQFDGKGKLTNKIGESYDGEWKQGKFHGMGKYTWVNSQYIFEGRYQKGVREGKGRFYFGKNQFLEGEWKKGRKEGRFEIKKKVNNAQQTLQTLEFKGDQLQNNQ